jgi:hypothetical protein
MSVQLPNLKLSRGQFAFLIVVVNAIFSVLIAAVTYFFDSMGITGPALVVLLQLAANGIVVFLTTEENALPPASTSSQTTFGHTAPRSSDDETSFSDRLVVD